MDNNKNITVEEVHNGLFSSCNCCNATTIKDGPASFRAKIVDKMYQIKFGKTGSILVSACENCLKQLIGEITVTLNGNIKEKDNLNSVKEFCKDKIKELEEIEDCDADEIHDCETSIDAFRDVLAFIHSLEK